MASLENNLMFMFLFFMLSVSMMIIASHAMVISHNAIKKTSKRGENELFIAGLLGYFIVVTFGVYIVWTFFKNERQYLWKILIAMAAVSLIPVVFIILGWKEIRSSDDYQYNSKYHSTYIWMLVLGFSVPVLTVALTLILSRMKNHPKIRQPKPQVIDIPQAVQRATSSYSSLDIPRESTRHITIDF